MYVSIRPAEINIIIESMIKFDVSKAIFWKFLVKISLLIIATEIIPPASAAMK